jgi:hypothetical protein
MGDDEVVAAAAGCEAAGEAAAAPDASAEELQPPPSKPRAAVLSDYEEAEEEEEEDEDEDERGRARTRRPPRPPVLPQEGAFAGACGQPAPNPFNVGTIKAWCYEARRAPRAFASKSPCLMPSGSPGAVEE